MATFRDRVAELHAELTLDTTEFSTGLAVAEARTQRAATEIAGSGLTMSRQMRGALQNTSFQIADVAVQLQAGQSAAIIFAQQGSQIAAAWGPVGAALGAAIAVGVPLAALLFDWGDASEEATGSLDDLAKSLGGLADAAPGAIVNVEKVIESLDELKGEARSVAEERLEVDTGNMVRELESARESADEFANRLRIAAEQTAVFGEDPEGAAGLAQLATGFREGTISAESFRDQLREFTAAGKVYSGITGEMATKSLEAAVRITELEQAVKDATAATQLAESGATFVPPAPESGAAARGLFEKEQAEEAERQRKEAERKRKEAERLAAEAERPVKAFERLAESVVRSSGELERLRNVQKEVNELAEQHPALQGRAAELNLQIDDTILQEAADQFAKIEASLSPAAEKLLEIEETQARVNELVAANPELQERAAAVLEEIAAAPVDELVEKFRSMADGLSPAEQRLANMREIQRELNELAEAMPELTPKIEAAKLEIDTSILEQTADQFRDIQIALDPNIARLEQWKKVQQEINDLVAANPALLEESRVVLEQLNLRYGEGYEILQAQSQVVGIVSNELTGAVMGAQSFGEAMANVAQRLAEAVIEALIFRAIMAVINPAGAGMVTAPGGALGNLFGGRTAQRGGIIRMGSVVGLPANNGGMLVEGTRDEAVLRLARTPSGDLGVKSVGGDEGRNERDAAGGGGMAALTTEVHIHPPANAQGRADQSRDGGRVDVFFDEMMAGNLRPGTRTAKALQSRFGVKPSAGAV